jgi:hypothetical protein
MKNITKFCILIITFLLTYSSNSLAQNQKKQIVKDSEESSFENEKIADKIINNNDEKFLEIDGKFYIGADALYQNSTLSGGVKNPYDYYEPQTSAVGVFAGYDNQDYYKIEGSYLKNNEKNQIRSGDNFSTFDLRTMTLGVDFKPYLVFDKKSRGLFYLIFGLNYNKIDISEFNQEKIYLWNQTTTKTTSLNSSVNKVSPIFGLGIEYLFYRNFALRLQYKRNFVDAKIVNSEVLNKVKIIDSLGVGISHAF